VSCLLATYVKFDYEITYSLWRANYFRAATRHIITGNSSFNDFIGDMPSCGLHFLNDLLQGFIFHLFEDLGFHVSLLKLLASLEGHKVFLAHIKEGILIVNRLISKLIFNHVSNGLGVLDLGAQGNIVVLVTLQFIIERVKYVLLYNLRRHR